jgi:quercetin dioxygenase-like cupin family protein
MSFFHNRSVFGAPDDDPDVVHLGAGCDVHFSHYDKGARSGPRQNGFTSRHLVTKGQLLLQIGADIHVIRAGEWFEIPPRTEYRVECLSACSIIEFCFAAQSTA